MIDLKGGRAVRGRSGDRASYRPVVSRLRGGGLEDLSDPVSLLRAYRETLDMECVYVADLDRIGGAGDNRPTIERLVESAPGLDLLLDEGPIDDRAAAFTPGRRILPVVATETLRSPADLAVSMQWLAAGDAFFSLDLGPEGVVARCPAVAALDASALLHLAARSGFRGAIVLLLDRVGTGAGLPRDRLRRLREAAPALDLFVAGGMASQADLAFLRSNGFAGALLATALHEGWIRPAHTSSAVGDGRRGDTRIDRNRRRST